MARSRKTVFLTLLALVGLIIIVTAVWSPSWTEHPAKAANEACAGHNGVREATQPASGEFLVVCNDGTAKDVDY